jgi:hypothetical protein
MIGLIALIVVGVYGFAVIWLTKLGWSYGARKYILNTLKDKGKALLCGCLGFALLTVPVFWEAIPTYLTYKITVRDEARLTIHKTFEQWQLENPDVTRELLQEVGGQVIDRPNGGYSYPINPRISIDTQLDKRLFTVVVTRKQLVDLKTREILANFNSVRSGNSGGLVSGGEGWWKVWLIHPSGDDSPEVSALWIGLNKKFRGEEIRK